MQDLLLVFYVNIQDIQEKKKQFSMHSNCSFKMKLITKKEAGFEPGTS